MKRSPKFIFGMVIVGFFTLNTLPFLWYKMASPVIEIFSNSQESKFYVYEQNNAKKTLLYSRRTLSDISDMCFNEPISKIYFLRDIPFVYSVPLLKTHIERNINFLAEINVNQRRVDKIRKSEKEAFCCLSMHHSNVYFLKSSQDKSTIIRYRGNEEEVIYSFPSSFTAFSFLPISEKEILFVYVQGVKEKAITSFGVIRDRKMKVLKKHKGFGVLRFIKEGKAYYFTKECQKFPLGDCKLHYYFYQIDQAKIKAIATIPISKEMENLWLVGLQGKDNLILFNEKKKVLFSYNKLHDRLETYYNFAQVFPIDIYLDVPRECGSGKGMFPFVAWDYSKDTSKNSTGLYLFDIERKKIIPVEHNSVPNASVAWNFTGSKFLYHVE